MTRTLTPPTHTALLVIDAQRDVMATVWNRDAVVGRIKNLVDCARGAHLPVVWVRHSDDDLPHDSAGWQIVSELEPSVGEPLIDKHYRDSFDKTTLASTLEGAGIDHIVVCGAQSDACVLATLFGAFARGFSVTLIDDAHTTEPDSRPEYPTPESIVTAINVIWGDQAVGDRRTAVISTQQACAMFARPDSPSLGNR
ncbi:MAG: isochorismatase family protein [Propionibacteriaceae bacterium]|jgi:nicotinamidase-related amidase|nr:isochorismatase family protein [Propionibacteriaceae bacterium]